jgi:hypothetical protein
MFFTRKAVRNYEAFLSLSGNYDEMPWVWLLMSSQYSLSCSFFS